MPLYEFECEYCGTRMEEFRDVPEPGPLCPICMEVTRRVYTAPALHFVSHDYNVGLGSTEGYKAVNRRRAQEGKSELIPIGDSNYEPVKTKKDLSHSEYAEISNRICEAQLRKD